LGLLGLSPLAFWSITLGELFAALEVYGKKEDEIQQAEWERVRWQTTLLLQPHAKKGARLTPEKLAVFPWEKKLKGLVNDPERVARNMKYAEENSYLSF
tara:strand:+ start:812 stop:1108 length:297 start_codon:yes stop_codon:yes gene_type:complete